LRDRAEYSHGLRLIVEAASMFLILRRHLLRLIEEVARGYAWVSLVPAWKAGLLLGAMTFLDPVIGAVGLLGAVCAWYAGQVAGADAGERPVCVFNGLLAGLYVAHVWVAGLGVVALAILGGVFSGWLTVVLGRLAWSLIRLPILSLPFALVAMLTSAAGSSLSTLRFNAYVAPPELFGSQIDKFLSAFGNFYFTPNPFAGLFVLSVLFAFSRYYFAIALTGYAAALFWLSLMGAAPEHLATTAWDSNAILAALLVGGLFARPSFLTAAMATLAAVIACWLALALGRILDVAHLVPFSVPFILAAWIVLYAVVRNTGMASSFNLLAPDFPERSYERAQISRARVGEPSSISLALPFMGVWTVSQGFSGQYTHRGPWRHALDFIVMKSGKSFSGKGNRIEDFYCYNLPVLSPAYGQVWRVVSDVPDNTPGTVNVAANWGNHVLIRLYDGKFALVAHLRPGSVTVAAGAWVKPGDIIGYCGNSGRSPQPHVHLHLQASDDSGAPTLPFHMASVLISEKDEPARYELSVVPRESSTLLSAVEGDARPFYLLAGRGLRYTVAHNENVTCDWTLRCEVDDAGRLSLVSSGGGRCIAESTWAVFSCYDRNDTADPYLDLWLLACGFTPASFHATRWEDHFTPARLIPHRMAKWLAVLAWPWATFAESSYRRRWDEEAQAWRQEASHRQNVSGIGLTSEALITPQLGCTYVAGEVTGSRYTLQATSSFQRADIGVPAWETPLALSVSFRRPV
jgi:murein DD-endopeptidase MepM/ murein hydrolase activator NlpD/urea transporter